MNEWQHYLVEDGQEEYDYLWNVEMGYDWDAIEEYLEALDGHQPNSIDYSSITREVSG